METKRRDESCRGHDKERQRPHAEKRRRQGVDRSETSLSGCKSTMAHEHEGFGARE